MTKKDYIALAAALKSVKPVYDGVEHSVHSYNGSQHQQWTECVLAVMNVLRADNPRTFNRQRFADACGVPNVMDP
jgi:hypothetical protein